MDVSIKSFDVDMDVKNKGFEREPNGGTMLGDLVVTKTHLIWCKGKTTRENGVKIRWTDFVSMVEGASPSKKPAKGASKKAGKSTPKKAAKKAAMTPAAEPAE